LVWFFFSKFETSKGELFSTSLVFNFFSSTTFFVKLIDVFGLTASLPTSKTIGLKYGSGSGGFGSINFRSRSG